MTRLSFVSLIERSVESHLTGVTDLELRQSASGETVLYAVSRSGAAISAFEIGPGAVSTFLDHQSLTTDAERLDFLDIDGTTYAVTFSPQSESTRLYAITDAGTLTGGAIPLEGESGAMSSVVQMEVGNTSFLFCADPASGLLDAFQIASGGALSEVATGSESLSASALARASAGPSQYLIAADAEGRMVRSYAVQSNGTLVMRGETGADDGLGLAGISSLQHVSTLDGDYVIVAARDSSSVSVLRMEADGSLVPVDHVIDDLSTRFQYVTSLETVTLEDRTFVIVGGADDGITLFELLPGGRLLHHDTMSDGFGSTLANVASIAAGTSGGELQIFVGSGTETGVTRLSSSPGPIGATRIGTNLADDLTGTDEGEVIWGRGGNDWLDGGAGDDILMDGAGRDTLIGGDGADIFVLDADGDLDVIRDFDPTQDRIDLTSWPMLRNLAQIDYEMTGDGCILRFGEEVLQIYSASGLPLLEAQVVTGALLPLTRVPAAEPEIAEVANDLNGDGVSDILWRNASTGYVGYYEMGASGHSWTNIGPVGLAWEIAGTGDFDGDGTDDILWRNTTTGGSGFFAMGSGSPVWGGFGQVSLNWQIEGVGDFNGDGTDDIVWRNTVTGGTGLFLMNGGSVTWQGLGANAAVWQIVGTGDVTGDGIDDIIWRNTTTGAVGMYEMSGAATPTWSAVTSLSLDWTLVGVGDLDGDGTDDLLWRNDTTGALGMHAMGSGSAVWQSLGQESLDWDIVGVGDYNGDGTDDILWRNVTSGFVGMYDMAGVTPTWQSIGPVGLGWDIDGQFVDSFVF